MYKFIIKNHRIYLKIWTRITSNCPQMHNHLKCYIYPSIECLNVHTLMQAYSMHAKLTWFLSFSCILTFSMSMCKQPCYYFNSPIIFHWMDMPYFIEWICPFPHILIIALLKYSTKS